MVARVGGKLDGYRGLALGASEERDVATRDRLVSHVCINTQNLWAEFCRAYALSTVYQPVRLGGQSIVLGDPAVTREEEVVAAAVRLCKANVYARGKWTRRDEPAWHDPNTLLRTLEALQVSNAQELRNAFSLGSSVFEDLPVFRNFYAHRSEYTAVKAGRIAYKYGIPRLEQPTEVLCSSSARAQPLIVEWMDDIWITVQLLCG